MNSQKRYPIPLLLTLVCALLLGACSSQPDNFVIIVMPSSGAFLPVQQETQIISQVIAKRGWSRLELYVNGELVRVDSATADTMYSAIIKQPWIPTAEVPVLISVIAVNERERRIASAEAAVLVGSPSPTPLPATPTRAPLPPPRRCSARRSAHLKLRCCKMSAFHRERSWNPGSFSRKPGGCRTLALAPGAAINWSLLAAAYSVGNPRPESAIWRLAQ